MHANGDGIPKDFVQAYAWYNLAATQGNKLASKNKDIVRKRMAPTQIAAAQKLSRELCAKIPNCGQALTR